MLTSLAQIYIYKKVTVSFRKKQKTKKNKKHFVEDFFKDIDVWWFIDYDNPSTDRLSITLNKIKFIKNHEKNYYVHKE